MEASGEVLNVKEEKKPLKPKAKPQEKADKQDGVMKKLDAETAKLLSSIKEKANKKPFGRKVRESEILSLALGLLKPEHIIQLQEATYSERDRLEMVHADYQKAHGKLTLDAFIGKLMRGEINLARAEV